MLHLMAKGAPDVETSRLLSLSPKTVTNYVSNILHKLQVPDRKEAIIRARGAGLGQKPECYSWQGRRAGHRRPLRRRRMLLDEGCVLPPHAQRNLEPLIYPR